MLLLPALIGSSLGSPADDSIFEMLPQVDLKFHAERHALLAKAARPEFAHVLSAEMRQELKLIDDELKEKRELRSIAKGAMDQSGATVSEAVDALQSAGVGSQAADLLQQIEAAEARQATLQSKADRCEAGEAAAVVALLAAASSHADAQEKAEKLDLANKAIDPLTSELTAKKGKHLHHKETLGKALAALKPESPEADFIEFEDLSKALKPHHDAVESASKALSSKTAERVTMKSDYDEAAVAAKGADKAAQFALADKASACGNVKLKKLKRAASKKK